VRYGLTVLLVIALAACGDRAADLVASDDMLTMDADQVMFRVRHHMTTGGVRRALVEADTAYLYEATSTVELRTVHVLLYDEHGQQRGTLTSLRGRLNTRTEAMTAEGNVILVTEDGTRIESEELHFDPEQDRIWSEKATTLWEDGSVVHGDGFTSDGQLRNVRVTRPTGRFEDLRIEF
jgi:LPS export ABC transporter protein LptC